MDYITFELRDLHHYGNAFYDYLALRKRFFVDALGWDIPHDDSVEMDQYDNPTARYSLVLDGGEVVAGARALPTTANWGTNTYMLRDARTGKLSGIPADLIDEEIVSKTMWECTRLVISERVEGMAERTRCLGLICEGLVEMAQAEGATELMSLSNLWLLRSLKSLGYRAELMSRPYVNGEDGHRYAVMKMRAERRMLRHLPQATHLSRPMLVHAPALA